MANASSSDICCPAANASAKTEGSSAVCTGDGADGARPRIGPATASWMFFSVFLSLYSVLVASWLADQAPALVAASAPLPAGFLIAYIAALVVELIGCVLLAIPFMRGRVQPRWVGYVLPAAALLTVVGSLLAPSGPASNLALNLLSNLGPVLLMAALGYLGFRLWSEHAPVKQAELETLVERRVGSL